jgi:hypothetical protein
MTRGRGLPLSRFGRACPKCVGTGVVWGGEHGLTPIAGCEACDGWGYELLPAPPSIHDRKSGPYRRPSDEGTTTMRARRWDS